MRGLNLSFGVAMLALTLLATAPSAANAQRRLPPAVAQHPAMVVPATPAANAHNTFTPNLGVEPSRVVQPVTAFGFSPHTGTFSAVGLSTAFTFPSTNTFSNNLRSRNAEEFATVLSNPSLRNFANHVQAREFREMSFGINPFAFSSPAFFNPYLAFGARTPYNPYMAFYNPYLSSGAYGGGYGGYSGGYGGGYGGYGGGYGGGTSNPYASYLQSPAPVTYTPPVLPTSPAFPRFVEVGMYDNRYEPKSITVAVGTTVRWTNYSNQRQTVTSDTGLWDSQGLAPGATTSYTFTQPGKYVYHSSVNPDLVATVIVQ